MSSAFSILSAYRLEGSSEYIIFILGRFACLFSSAHMADQDCSFRLPNCIIGSHSKAASG